MAEELTRVIKRKRIKAEGTVAVSVDVPVIVKITFKDDSDRGWESQYTIDNSSQADRSVHVATITGEATDETGEKDGLKVERIDMLRVLDSADRGQETFFAPDSRTVNEPPDAPPYFVTHEKTHIVRYLNTPDDGDWIESELIDEFRFTDPNDRGQDTYIRLFNPPDNQDIDGITIGEVDDGDGNKIPTVQVSPDLPDISDSNPDSENSIDPPWRIDPFQNIVRCSQHMPFFWVYQAILEPGGNSGTGYHWVNVFDPADPAESSGTTPDGKPFTISGKPTISPFKFKLHLGEGPDPPFLISIPWWVGGPNTDIAATPGLNHYRVDGADATVSQSWTFYGQFNPLTAPLIWGPVGSTTAKLGPLTLTVDGRQWVCEYVQIAMFCWPEPQYGGLVNFMPSFTASFRPGR